MTTYTQLLAAIQASDPHTAPQARQSVLADLLSDLLETQRAANRRAWSEIAASLAPIAERCATEALNTAAECMNRVLTSYVGDSQSLPLLAGVTDLAMRQVSQYADQITEGLSDLLAADTLTPITGLRSYTADGPDDDPNDHTEEAN